MMRERVNRWYNRFMQANANRLFAAILSTPPIPTDPDAETVLYCALGKTACRQYLAAAKSLLRYEGAFRVVVQSDGTLGPDEVRELRTHLPGVTVWSKEEMFAAIEQEAGPALLELLPDKADYAAHTSIRILYLKFLNVVFRLNGSKVVIIDSDLLFLRRPDFILEWAGRPYQGDFYGEGSNARAADFHAMGFDFSYLDVANFSSGTIGVGGRVTHETLADIFARVRAYDPSLLLSWEIEQALWAVVMGGRPGAVNIDDLREVYVGSGWRCYRELKEKAVIAHFAGAVRFNGLKYLRCLGDVVAGLRKRGDLCDTN